MGVIVGPMSWSVKVIVAIVIWWMLFRCVSAKTNHSVGGSTGWDLASDLRAWAAATTLYAGDNLVFRYGPSHDVLEVNRSDFAACETINPIKAYRDGETVVPLEEGGTTRYFFCGRNDHCSRGLKLEAQVLLHNTTVKTPSSSGGNSRHSPPPPPPPPLRRQANSQHLSPPPLPGNLDRPGHPPPLPPAAVGGEYCRQCSGAGVSVPKLIGIDDNIEMMMSWVHAAGLIFLRCWTFPAVIAFHLLNS
ncbi:cucumber peeling cupredoxin-like [Actinidia eriantha]|uniref:cucumber peeling cupredoxin-like n=1 Tax=Actinidia eriantha TaxID=165200 RepID=UPI00258B5B76|nr:cucumber peeling cupredoxin-like [Actinidia eriantha]